MQKQKRNKKEMEIVQFAWSLRLQHSALDVSLPAKERRQTAIKIRSLFSGSVRGYYVLGPPSRFFDRFVESGFEFRSGLRNPRVGTHAWARNAIVFRPDGHFKTNTCLSPEKRSPYLLLFIPNSSRCLSTFRYFTLVPLCFYRRRTL